MELKVNSQWQPQKLVGKWALLLSNTTVADPGMEVGEGRALESQIWPVN